MFQSGPEHTGFGVEQRVIALKSRRGEASSGSGEFERPAGPMGVSPDDAYVVAVQIEHNSSDLMLVENFR